MEKEINQKNEIITLFNHIRLKHLNVTLKDKNNQNQLTCFVTKVDNNSFGFVFDKIPDMIPVKNLLVCFEYNKNFYSSNETNVRLINVPLKSIELLPIEKIFYHPMRRYTRVEVPDLLNLSIKRVETQANDSAQNISMDELPATLRSIYVELKGANPDIKKIIGMVGEELSRFSNKYKIDLFKDGKPSTPLEKVVSFFKKTFWIEDTDNLNNYIHLRDKYNVIGYEKYFELAKKQLSPDILEEVRNNYTSRGIGSYAMVPILIGERVVGVIEISVPGDSNFKKLSVYEIFYIKGLADILGEVVVKSKSDSTTAYSNMSVLDISLGGILANTKNVYLAHNIKENSEVVLSLKFEDKEIDLKAKVVRYNYIPGENGGLNVAFEYTMVDENTKIHLGNLIRAFLKMEMEKQKKDEPPPQS